MSNWYKEIEITFKNNNTKVDEIINKLLKKYVIDKDLYQIDGHIFSFYGEEGCNFYIQKKPGKLPDIEELCVDIAKASPDINYIGYAIPESSNCNAQTKYTMNYRNGKLEVFCTEPGEPRDLSEYDNYEEFYDFFGPDYLSKKEFKKLRKKDIVYFCETGIYTKEEYEKTKSIIFSCEVNDLIKIADKSQWPKFLKMLEENVEFINYFPDNLKNDREFILEAINVNGFVLAYLDSELAHDKTLAIEAIKKDPYCFDSLDNSLKEDKKLQKLSEKLLEEMDYD